MAAKLAAGTADQRSALMAEFPNAALGTGLQNTWRPAALSVYEKWVSFLSARKAERRNATAAIKSPRLRRIWRDWPLPLQPRAKSLGELK